MGRLVPRPPAFTGWLRRRSRRGRRWRHRRARARRGEDRGCGGTRRSLRASATAHTPEDRADRGMQRGVAEDHEDDRLERMGSRRRDLPGEQHEDRGRCHLPAQCCRRSQTGRAAGRRVDKARRLPPAAISNAATAASARLDDRGAIAVVGQFGATSQRNRAPNSNEAYSVASAASVKTIAHQEGGRSTSECGGALSPWPIGSGPLSVVAPVPRVQTRKSTITIPLMASAST